MSGCSVYKIILVYEREPFGVVFRILTKVRATNFCASVLGSLSTIALNTSRTMGARRTRL